MTRLLTHSGHEARSATQNALSLIEQWTRPFLLERGHLLAERQILDN